MNVLVTGGAGFIGNQLAVRLVDDGHSVEIVDSVNEYYDPSLKEARLARLGTDVSVHRVDITDQSAIEKVFNKGRFDAVCHLAAQAGVRYSLEHPDVYVQSNYVGTFNIFELAKQYDIRQVVFASTSSVYGASTDMPFKEDNPVTTPMSIYAATKRGGELLAANYNHLNNMNITCLRFFTVYGPWSRPDMAPILFTEKILGGETINVFNNGDMQRDFTYIDDIVEGFTLALKKPLGFEIINLGYGSPVHLMDFIKTLEAELGVTAQINFMPLQPGDVPNTWADTQKAEDLLGFKARVPMEEGTQQFVQWYREYYQV